MRKRRAVMLAVVLITAGGRPARPQAPATEATRQPPVAATVADTGARFRFIERYATEPDRTKPEVLTQYRVAVLETIKSMTEQPQSAPVRSESAFRTVYTERAARVGTGSGGDVLAAVRHYDSFRAVPDRSGPQDARPLEGMTLWYHPRIGDEPEILTLTDRQLRETDYFIASRQMFLPDLRGLLPGSPSRVGDSWPIPVSAMRALFCDPTARGRSLLGKLVGVREEKPKDGPAQWVAAITISGWATLAVTGGETAVNAELDFRFTPPARDGAATAKKSEADESIIEAHGAMTELRMAVSRTAPIGDDPKIRLRQVTTWEFVLQRRPSGDGAALVAIPNPPPSATEANSWLTIVPPVDPQVPRFTFRHPQDLQPPPIPDLRPSPTAVTLWDHWPEPRDQLTFELTLKTGKAEEDRQFRDPEYHRRQMLAQWEKDRLDVVQGRHEWLPASDWAAHNMKVWRMQASLKETRKELRAQPRSYIDFYLVLFGRDQCLLVTAMTTQDPPTAFRKQAEAILKTFRFDPATAQR